jgi:hypothetical protein
VAATGSSAAGTPGTTATSTTQRVAEPPKRSAPRRTQTSLVSPPAAPARIVVILDARMAPRLEDQL